MDGTGDLETQYFLVLILYPVGLLELHVSEFRLHLGRGFDPVNDVHDAIEVFLVGSDLRNTLNNQFIIAVVELGNSDVGRQGLRQPHYLFCPFNSPIREVSQSIDIILADIGLRGLQRGDPLLKLGYSVLLIIDLCGNDMREIEGRANQGQNRYPVNAE